MSWIDDDAAESERQRESAAKLASRNPEIAASAEKIYNALWDEIVERIGEAKAKGHATAANLIANGDRHERQILKHQIIVPQPVKPSAAAYSEPKHIIRLSADHLKN
jgi:hypothetical protein